MATIIYSTDIDINTDDVIEKITTEELVEELRLRQRNDETARDTITKLLSEYNSQQHGGLQDKFESSPAAALTVLQDLLGMQHTTSKEQVIEQLKSVL